METVKMSKNCIVIFSGGLDSTVLLQYVKQQGYNIYGMSFLYGQRHSKELHFAKKLGNKYCGKHKILILDFMKDIAGHSALTGKIQLPTNIHQEHETQKATVVPNRNAVMLSIATAWAEDLHISKIFYGAHRGDFIIYPDCRKKFVKYLSKAFQVGTYSNVKIEAPFVKLYKSELIKKGIELKVDFKNTWTCYEGKKVACGVCGSCKERIEAFKKNKLIDPIKYNVNVDWSDCKEIKY